jgi:hypothetical protein
MSAALAANSAKIDASVGAAEACAAQGGVVSTVADGKVCTTPPARCVSRSQSGFSYAVDPNNTSAVTSCFNDCGRILTAADGSATCTIKAAAAQPHYVPYGPEPAPISVARPPRQPK